jgi:hypothetical protein
MKPTLLLLSLSFLVLTSCSSEYDERMSKAKALKIEMLKALNNRHILGVIAEEQIADLRKEINFHAKVSGNEELFFNQLALDLH